MRLLAGLLAVTLLVAGIGVRLTDRAARDGQVVFSPVATLGPVVDRAGSSPLRISACRKVVGGLQVTGRVVGGPSPVEVVVTGGQPSSSSVRLGLGFLTDSRPQSNAQVGDFVVILPWATTASGFAVLPADGSPTVAHGPITACPGAQPESEMDLDRAEPVPRSMTYHPAPVDGFSEGMAD